MINGIKQKKPNLTLFRKWTLYPDSREIKKKKKINVL